ncbi:MAG: transglutaminase-like domain-containing protein [Candidatus Heimdallarchaeota archaeon]|nr:transglutaminase-like domain-containing protein [Candidatus Heimdallarchaeota archaeon]MDH5644521.1 transglutaminase-like domain-containing protein [Candidatus Heimdallarchaeota archaeon]
MKVNTKYKNIIIVMLLLIILISTFVVYNQEKQSFIKGQANYQLTYNYLIENKGPIPLNYLGIRLAILKSWDNLQQVNTITSNIQPNRTVIDEYDNNFAWYEMDQFAIGGVLNISFDVDLSVNILDYTGLNIENPSYDKQNEQYSLYMAYDPLADPNDLRIKSTVISLPYETESIVDKVFASYNFTSTYLRYRLIADSKGASFAITNGYGDCDEYMNLFIALNRANGIPTIGHTAWFADFQKGYSTTDQGSVAHAYPMFYVEGLGLIPADPTRGKDSLFDNWMKKDHQTITMTRGPDHPYRLLRYRWQPIEGLPSPEVVNNYTVSIKDLEIEYFSNIRRSIILINFAIPVLFIIYNVRKSKQDIAYQKQKLDKLLNPRLERDDFI